LRGVEDAQVVVEGPYSSVEVRLLDAHLSILNASQVLKIFDPIPVEDLQEFQPGNQVSQFATSAFPLDLSPRFWTAAEAACGPKPTRNDAYWSFDNHELLEGDLCTICQEIPGIGCLCDIPIASLFAGGELDAGSTTYSDSLSTNGNIEASPTTSPSYEPTIPHHDLLGSTGATYLSENGSPTSAAVTIPALPESYDSHGRPPRHQRLPGLLAPTTPLTCPHCPELYSSSAVQHFR
jgi:hypothetical protein